MKSGQLNFLAKAGILTIAGIVVSLASAETVRMSDREVFVRAVNYDEAKVAPYALENPLVFTDGHKVTKENWTERRKEILAIFAKEMYGQNRRARRRW